MKKNYILLIGIILISTNLFSQSKDHLHTTYFEFGGAALFYSVNYELGNFFVKNNRKVNFRIGASLIPTSLFVFQPIAGATIEWGRKYCFQLSYNLSINNSFGIGFIRRPINGLYFHIKYYAIITYQPQEFLGYIGQIFPWFSFGVGYSIAKPHKTKYE